jgi:hypothetical protein
MGCQGRRHQTGQAEPAVLDPAGRIIGEVWFVLGTRVMTNRCATSPKGPQNSAPPIQRIWAWLKPSAQPILLDATSWSFHTPSFISLLNPNTTRERAGDSARCILTSSTAGAEANPNRAGPYRESGICGHFWTVFSLLWLVARIGPR